MNGKNDLHKSYSKLKSNHTPGARVAQLAVDGWRLVVPSGQRGNYRLAQIDDYAGLARESFPWRPPLTLSLQARVSSPDIPGTWGFGLWNDPFSLSLGLGGGTRRFPALPNAAWFFSASPQNYLSFRSDRPAQGFLAQTFRAPQIPAPLLGLAGLGFPGLLWPWLARKLRKILNSIILEDSKTFRDSKVLEDFDWHHYQIEWGINQVTFRVDDQIFETPISPKGPLGLVIWLDNQYAAFPPDGRLSFGTLESSEEAWLEIKSFDIF